MERLKQRLQLLNKVIARLGLIIGKLNESRNNVDLFDEIDIQAYRDSTIKKFEICYELFWKFLKDYLEHNNKILIVSPKKVFHECFKQNIVSEAEVVMLLKMADDRNLTTHCYDEDMAEEISQNVNQYYQLIQTILTRL